MQSTVPFWRLFPDIATRMLPALLPLALTFSTLGLPTRAAADAALSAVVVQGDIASQIDAAFSASLNPAEPGAAVLVVKDGKTLLRKGYGLADIDKKVPIQPGDLFRIGSMTKQFTAVAILLLEDEGKLSVQDDITRYLPDYPTKGKRITIEHLLTHTSGMILSTFC